MILLDKPRSLKGVKQLVEILGLHVELGTMAFTLAAFLILLFLLSQFALKPLMRVMQQRQERIEEELKKAEAAREEAAKLIKDNQEAIIAARQEANAIIERAKSVSEREGQAIVEAARKEAERVRDQALAEIAREREAAIVALKEEVSKLSVLIAAKVIEKEIDAKKNRELVDQYLNQVGGLQ